MFKCGPLKFHASDLCKIIFFKDGGCWGVIIKPSMWYTYVCLYFQHVTAILMAHTEHHVIKKQGSVIAETILKGLPAVNVKRDSIITQLVKVRCIFFKF